MSRRLLALESATDWLSIALAEDDGVVLWREAERTRQHSAALLPLVQSALAELDWRVSQLDALAVSAGPGSFTSLRIGLASAKGLAFGRDWQGVGVSTLEAMAMGALDGAEEGAQVVALLDARRGEWYAGGWRRPREGRSAGLVEGLYDPETMAQDLKGPVTFCCPDRSGWHAAFAAAGLPVDDRIEGERARPRADRVARLGIEALARGEGEPVEALAARYLRRAEAEAQRLGGPVERGELARVAPSEG
ncbi:MAG: tRNA (adenosine(37)-N6)-threonylcarbamoyltransferase complex dimerization subunit type 1 TsaB [Myxococcota bacterium]